MRNKLMLLRWQIAIGAILIVLSLAATSLLPGRTVAFQSDTCKEKYDALLRKGIGSEVCLPGANATSEPGGQLRCGLYQKTFWPGTKQRSAEQTGKARSIGADRSEKAHNRRQVQQGPRQNVDEANRLAYRRGNRAGDRGTPRIQCVRP